MGNTVFQALADDEEMSLWESVDSSYDAIFGNLMAFALLCVMFLLASRAWQLLSQLFSRGAAADTEQEAGMRGTGIVKTADRVDRGGCCPPEDFQSPLSRNWRGERCASPYLSESLRVESETLRFGGCRRFECIQSPSSRNWPGELYASSDLIGTGRVKSEMVDSGGDRKVEDLNQWRSSGSPGKVCASPSLSGTRGVKGVRVDGGNKRQLEDLERPSPRNGGETNTLPYQSLPAIFNGKPSITGVPKPISRTKEIKFLTWNVWCREDVKVKERISAIGKLIKNHSPQLICFQEVTPNIYEMFQNSKWWKSYGCSVSAEEASRRGPFSMQLSTLPAKFHRERLVVGNIEREHCMAEVDVGMGRKLVFAAGHLVSPKPCKKRLCSTERRALARMAIGHLKNKSNVVFGGDMNWDEKVDGGFPLPPGWNDAWKVLRPREDGWTFDTRANKMLSGRPLLQKRLDRFLYCLKDFNAHRIKMIGMEPIPKLSFKKKKVLPSDHFGLLLTLHTV